MTDKLGTVLIVDDEQEHADGLVESLSKLPVRAMAVYSKKDALDILRHQSIDIILTDLKLENGTDGLEILDKAKQKDPLIEVILITAYATIDTCKDALRRGASDYLVKPIDIDQLRTIIQQTVQRVHTRLSRAKTGITAETGEFIFEGVLGTSPAMQTVIDVARRVASTNISVLIEGESGTGKELLAHAIHNNSQRRGKPFQPINCAGLSETLLESELFGHVKGAFTGAASDRKGHLELANEGTLFLDEIGDMPISMQAKLLRVLEDGVVVPVGATKSIFVDVRVISATNQDFQKLIEQKQFREDLYFRIKGVNISLPALRERSEDIPLLVKYFMNEAVQEIGAPIIDITENALHILSTYRWPGNLRQLRNCIRNMVVMCDRDALDVQDIPPDIAARPQLLSGPEEHTSNLAGVPLDELEKKAIADTLIKTGGNREKAAKILGIGERTLYRKIKEYDL